MPRKEYQPLPILIRGRNKKKPLVTNPNLMTTPVDLSLFFYLGGKMSSNGYGSKYNKDDDDIMISKL